MNRHSHQFLFSRFAFFAITVFLAACSATGARGALTTESPEVKRCVARGIKFLESSENDGRVGALALRGLALFKNGAEAAHPMVAYCAAGVSDAADDGNLDSDIYSLGLAIIFLVSLDPETYKSEIESLLATLEKSQKDHGGWGYKRRATGDTSMTQYSVLAMWEAAQVGFRPKLDSWERVANWLLRTQDPTGAFGYQGNDPGNFSLVPQSGVRHSMAAAGTGSIYICADRFGMVRLRAVGEDVPSALKPVSQSDQGDPKLLTRNVNPKRMSEARARGNGWLDKNFTVEPGQWVYYYLYAYERYRSFREAAEKRRSAEAPTWYDNGARFLIASQEENGSWEEQGGTIPDTAFAVLFLLRSTRKSIQRAKTYGAGTLIGGRGLPKDTVDVRLRRGKIVAKPLSGPAEELFSIIENPKHKDFFRAIESLGEFALEDGVDALAAQSDRLLKLAEQGSPEARAAAVRALARTRDLDHVPALITALNDPDLVVMLEARDGLRFISRKLRGFGLAAQSNETGVKAAAKKWREWYQAVRPGSPLID